MEVQKRKGATTKASYQVVSEGDRGKLAECLQREGQFLLPMLDLLERAELAVDEVIDVAGRAAVEAILEMSAEGVAGPTHPGQARGEVRRHGHQKGVVCLAERKLRVTKPRLRTKGPGPGAEVPIPAYEAMATRSRLGRRMLEILMAGVSTRNYRKVLPGSRRNGRIRCRSKESRVTCGPAAATNLQLRRGHPRWASATTA